MWKKYIGNFTKKPRVRASKNRGVGAFVTILWVPRSLKSVSLNSLLRIRIVANRGREDKMVNNIRYILARVRSGWYPNLKIKKKTIRALSSKNT